MKSFVALAFLVASTSSLASQLARYTVNLPNTTDGAGQFALPM